MELSIFATNDIYKGNEIFNCYGPNHKLMSRQNRQRALEDQYCFKCNCDHCAISQSEVGFFITLYFYEIKFY